MNNTTPIPTTTLHLPICDKVVTAEVICDYSMPDYQPEVRRLLRVRADVGTPASYVGAGRAEFAGALRFHILYAGNDGKLYSATVSDNYEMAAPLDKDADVDYSDELIASCDVSAESVTGRVTAPRKLSLRCRLRGRIRAFGRHRLCERLMGAVPESGIERLAGESQAAVLCPRTTESFTLSDEVPAEGREGELRVISAEAALSVSETLPSEEGVGCRGEAHLKILACRDGADDVPFVMTRRVPFAVNLSADGYDGEVCCRAVARCDELTAEVTEDGRVLCDLSCTVTVEGQKNLPVSYTADLYATDRESGATFTEYKFPRAARCIGGNFTQSVYEPLTSFGMDGDCEAVDLCGTAAVESVVYDRGHWVITGDSRLNLLVSDGEEYAAHDIVLPFRYEADGEEGVPMLVSADVTMVSGRARIESGRLGLECEMAVSARICTEGSLVALSEARFGEAWQQPTEMVVAFPTRGETLWELAKRYHVSTSALARLNATPADPTAVLATGVPLVVNE